MNVFDIIASVAFGLILVRITMIVRRTLRLHQLNKQVVETYKELFASPDPKALYDYWASLHQTCSAGKLCIECEREMLMQGEP